MLFPRFNLRTILAVTTVAALFFVLVGTGYRGQKWAWAASIGLGSLAVTALVQIVCFFVVKSVAACTAWLNQSHTTQTQHASGTAAEMEATT